MFQVKEVVEQFQQLPFLEQEDLLKTLHQTHLRSMKPQLLSELKFRYLGEWLAVVIPKDEEPYDPAFGILLAHHTDRSTLWDLVEKSAAHQNIYVFYSGPIAAKGFGVVFHDTTDTPEVATMVED